MRRDRRIAMVSGVPRQSIGTLGEALTVPMINLLLLGYLPGGGRAFTGAPSMAAACGQLMMLRAPGLSRRSAGTARCAACCMTGCSWRACCARAASATEVVDGAPLATCRMYRGFARSLARLRQECARRHGDAGRPADLDGDAGRRASLALGAAAGHGRPSWRWRWCLALRAAITLRAREPWWTIAAASRCRAGGAGHPVDRAGALAAGAPAGWKGRAYRPQRRHEPAMTGFAARRRSRRPPTRDHDAENFPIASLLLAKRAAGEGDGLLPLRPHRRRHRRQRRPGAGGEARAARRAWKPRWTIRRPPSPRRGCCTTQAAARRRRG